MSIHPVKIVSFTRIRNPHNISFPKMYGFIYLKSERLK